MHYRLDFETIRLVIQTHQSTGWLRTQVSEGVAGLPEECSVEIIILAGVISSCAIVSKSGEKITGQQATQVLSRLGKLCWTFTQEPEVVLSPADSSFFPRRTVQLKQEQMRTWSRVHKRVFALADGTKHVTKIAQILSTSPGQVERALRDLQSIGVVVMRSQDGKKE